MESFLDNEMNMGLLPNIRHGVLNKGLGEKEIWDGKLNIMKNND